MIKTVEQSREREYKVYIKALEVENHQLSEKLEQMAVKSVNIITPTSTFREATEKIVAGMEAERDAFIVKYKELETKYKMSCEGLADRNRKIVFLEKLIIEKDNN